MVTNSTPSPEELTVLARESAPTAKLGGQAQGTRRRGTWKDLTDT